MSIKQRLYDNIPYLFETGPRGSDELSKLGKVSFLITPDNLPDVAKRADEIFQAIAFDSLIFTCKHGQDFEFFDYLELLAPYIKKLIVNEVCGRIDFAQFEKLKNLVSIYSLIPKPKNLRLCMFPLLRMAILGIIHKVDVLENAESLECLKLMRNLQLENTGWLWLSTLPRL